MLRLFRKVNEIHSRMYSIGDDDARAEYSKVTFTWNAYGRVDNKFELIGKFSTKQEAITAAKKHKVR